ncbi:MAG: hypothetical protein RR887_06385 [Niameybacter sp.]
MKKKLFPMLLLALALVFTGCSTTQLEFWSKCQESSNWAASTIKGTMNMDMTMQGETMKMVMTMDGIANTEDMSSELTMNMDMSAAGMDMKMHDIQIFMKDGKMYMSKNYFVQLFETSGLPVPASFANPEVEFITFTDDNAQIAMIMEMTQQGMLADKEKYADMMKDISTELGLDVEITKKDNTYTIDLDEKEMLAFVKQIILTTANNMESLNKKYNLNIPDEDITALKAQMDEVKVQLDQLIPLAEAMVKGNVKVDYTFGKDQVNEKMTMNMTIPVLDNAVFNMTMDMVVGKAEAKEIVAPTKVLEMTQAELMNEMMPQMVVINRLDNTLMNAMGQSESCQVIVKNNEVYIPAKLTLGYLGQEVKYDAVAKKAGIEVGGTFKALNTISEKGISYVSLTEVQNLGYTVEATADFITIQ